MGCLNVMFYNLIYIFVFETGPKDNVRSISCQTRQIDLTEDNKHIISKNTFIFYYFMCCMNR